GAPDRRIARRGAALVGGRRFHRRPGGLSRAFERTRRCRSGRVGSRRRLFEHWRRSHSPSAAPRVTQPSFEPWLGREQQFLERWPDPCCNRRHSAIGAKTAVSTPLTVMI